MRHGEEILLGQNSDIAQYSRKPAVMRFPKIWEHMTARQKRENLLDRGSIYGRPRLRQRLPRPGHRDVLIKDATDVGVKEERRFLQRVTGYPRSAHISGSAHIERSRPAVRQPTANTICQEYQYVHNGLRGKMFLNSKTFRDQAKIRLDCHDDDKRAHFCEVLGQRTCAECIEDRNRQMAEFYQNRAFPTIEMTATSLIAPKLSKSLTPLKRRNAGRGASWSTSSGQGLLSRSHVGHSSIISPLPYRTTSAVREPVRVFDSL